MRSMGILGLVLVLSLKANAQDESLIERVGPPALESFEKDTNGDLTPDGWYNLRDARLVSGGVGDSKQCLRFENQKPGRPARASRAFGLNGRVHEAIIIGMWLRLPDQTRTGERVGDDPGLMIDFLGDGLKAQRRGIMGPWTNKLLGSKWVHVAKRIAVPPGTRDAIMSIGLLGAIGTLEVDDLSIELVPVGGSPSNNLIVNGGFELGEAAPAGWVLDKNAIKITPGYQSNTAIELKSSGALAILGLALPVDTLRQIEVSVMAKATQLRGTGGASSTIFFLDIDGQPVRDQEQSLFEWSGSSDWRASRQVVNVPGRAVRAVLQFEKYDPAGSLRLDDVVVNTAPDREVGRWIPYHVATDTSTWVPIEPCPQITVGSALDASTWFEPITGPITIKSGRFFDAVDNRARFFGVALLAPTAFSNPSESDALAERLARSGVNLVRLGDLDTPLGPGRCLFDDTRDDTQGLDPLALANLDHLLAALKKRSIAYAIEFHSVRRFREGDKLTLGPIPPGGGPASSFDPSIRKLQIQSALALLDHVNPLTKLAIKNDPSLAWVTLAGEVSIFDQLSDPSALTSESTLSLREALKKHLGSTGRKAWAATEGGHWKEIADALRAGGLKAPIASVSHWRREPDYVATLSHTGLDLIDDRLYWNPTTWVDPDHKSQLWTKDGGLAAGAILKRKYEHPYVVGQWCAQTLGAWAMPYEGADALLAARIAASEDWDALIRRGIFVQPALWGASAAGTGGLDDIFQLPEVINGSPQIYAFFPHAASIYRRGHEDAKGASLAHAKGAKPKAVPINGWEPDRGRLVIDTPYSQGLAGWPGGDAAGGTDLAFSIVNHYGTVMASSAGPKPISESKRLLVTALARIEPTGLKWVDTYRREVADPGTAPLLMEPIEASVTWKHKGNIKAYALDATGKRLAEVKLVDTGEGVKLVLDGKQTVMHWELVNE